MNRENKILSDIIVWDKYAQYNPIIQRREVYSEIIDRNKQMHLKRFPELKDQINHHYQYVYDRKVLPAMRSLQFGGEGIERNHARMYNCWALPMDSTKSFADALFLLLSGGGVGIGVHRESVEQLPEILPIDNTHATMETIVVGDSIEGWSYAFQELLVALINGNLVHVDYSKIRKEGSLISSSGAKAPGPKGLKRAFNAIIDKFEEWDNACDFKEYKLTPEMVSDIMCIASEAVISGGIRRSAMIIIFDHDEEDMLTYKYPENFEYDGKNKFRSMANISAQVHRDDLTYQVMSDLIDNAIDSGSGEAGMLLTNKRGLLSNPCFTGDNRLMTDHGFERFDSLGEHQKLRLVNKNGEIVDGTVFSNGVKDIVEVKYKEGKILKSIRCTPDHRFMVDGKEVEAQDLKGKRLTPFYRLKKDFNDHEVKLGFLQGDGSLRKNWELSGHKNAEVNINWKKDKDVADLFTLSYNEDKRQFTTDVGNAELKAAGFDFKKRPDRGIPSGVMKNPFIYDDFLTGLFSANGCVIKGSRVALKTTSEKERDGVMEMLTTLGINSYYTTNQSKLQSFNNGTYLMRESYDVNIGTFSGIVRFAESISFVQKYKVDKLRTLIADKSPKVTSVKPAGAKEVFDFTLYDNTHWGVVEGVIAHNCAEIALQPRQACNLVEIKGDDIDTGTPWGYVEMQLRIEAATFIATLQASYTDIPFVDPRFIENLKKEALIGVSITGAAGMETNEYDLRLLANTMVAKNVEVSKLIGINPAYRIGTIKPAGTTSLVLGTSSGIHAYYSAFYRRRVTLYNNSALYKYLMNVMPEFVEDKHGYEGEQSYLCMPQKAPKGAVVREEETAVELFDRAMMFNKHWIGGSHVEGENKNNVSLTINVKKEEIQSLKDKMWNERNDFTGVSLYPFYESAHGQTPFEVISEDEYNRMMSILPDVDMMQILESDNNTDLSGESACSGGQCEVK